MPGLISSRVYLGLKGVLNLGISEDIVSLSFDDSLNRLRFVLNNWDGVEYPYSDGTLFQIGTGVELLVGPDSADVEKMFEGEVTAIAPTFASGKPPTILIETIGVPVRKRTQTTAELGRNLIEFRPVLSAGNTIECSGTTTGDPELRSGSILAVEGAGRGFDRAYFVSKTIHNFDPAIGYRTHFTASTRKPHTVRPDIEL